MIVLYVERTYRNVSLRAAALKHFFHDSQYGIYFIATNVFFLFRFLNVSGEALNLFSQSTNGP